MTALTLPDITADVLILLSDVPEVRINLLNYHWKISKHIIQVREKAFREMKKDVGMTTAQKSKETRRMEMGSILFCISSQQSLHIRTII